MRVGVAISTVGVLWSGCLRTTTYKCTSNDQCGANGACESNGLCSFPESSCPSGRKFGDLAGDNAGQCVGMLSADAGVDVPVDMPPPSCPTGYTANGTSSYRAVTVQDDWLAAEQDCENDGTGTHLVVINDMAEYTALDAISQGNNLWVGASDRVTEATWLWVTGAAAPALGMANTNDCARYGGGGMGGLSDQGCLQTEEYVCECDGIAAMPTAYTP